MSDLGHARAHGAPALVALGAFRKDATIKDDLLKALDGGASLPLVEPRATQPELIAWADEVGLPAAFVLLAASLHQGIVAADPVTSPGRDLIAAIAPGADIAAVAHRFAIWAWEAAPERLCDMMQSPPFRHAGGEVIDLHRRAAAGEAIDRGAWRTARATLGRLSEGGDEQALAAAVLAACAWDYRTTPGAAVDMVTAWLMLIAARLRAADGWGEAEDARMHQMIGEQRLIAEERVGPAPDEDDADAFAAHAKRVIDELLTLVNTSVDPLPLRKAALNTRLGEARSTLRRQGASALLSLVRARAPAETP